MHADPAFPDLKPGEKYAIDGELYFFEGSISDFEKFLRQNQKDR